MTRRRDAIIIGAGAAGLAAAWELSHAGRSAVVLEARPRIGGRVLTLHDAASPLPIELGAEFVHGEAEETFAMIRAAQLLVDELPDEHYWSRDGKLATIPDFWGKIDEVRRDIARHFRGKKAAADLSFRDYLERTDLPADFRQMLLNFVEGYHAAHPERISAHSLAAGDEETQGEAKSKQFRIISGNDALLHWLQRGLHPENVEVRLSTIAAVVRWKAGEVIVHCQSSIGAPLGPFRARAAIITVPTGAWQAKAGSPGALRFVPELDSTRRAISKLESGNVFKIVLRFRRAFWEDQDFISGRLAKPRENPAELNFVHGREVDVPTWWTALPARAPILTGWAGGPRGESLLSESETTRVERSIAALSTVLGVPRRTLEDLLDSWAMHDWRSDPFSRGAYTYVGVGGVSAQKAAARPVEGTIFIAGEMTDAEQTGTVAGAIASGRRAARELLRRLES